MLLLVVRFMALLLLLGACRVMDAFVLVPRPSSSLLQWGVRYEMVFQTTVRRRISATTEVDTKHHILRKGDSANDAALITKEKKGPRRVYESYRWNYKDGKSYNINYRVGDQPKQEQDGDDEKKQRQPSILLVHGFGANVNHFRFQFPALQQAGYDRVYAIDLLGFGASDKPVDIQYSIELFVQLIADFVRDHNNSSKSSNINNSHDDDDQPDPSWFLAGNSIGGLCCLGAAERLLSQEGSDDDSHAGAPVQGVILLNCSGGMSGFRYRDLPIFIRPVFWVVQNVVLNPSISCLSSRFFANFKTRENVQSILLNQVYSGNTTNVNEELLQLLLEPAEDPGAEGVFLRIFGGPPGPTPESILAVLPQTLPVLALWGDTDNWTPVDGGAHPGDGFGRYHANYELQILPNTGHCPHDENPVLVNSKMIAWMERQQYQKQQQYQP